MNGGAVCLMHHSVCIAGKHRSHRDRISPTGARLLAMDDGVVCLNHLSV